MQYTQQAAAVTAEVNKAVQGKQQTVNTIWMAMPAWAKPRWRWPLPARWT